MLKVILRIIIKLKIVYYSVIQYRLTVILFIHCHIFIQFCVLCSTYVSIMCNFDQFRIFMLQNEASEVTWICWY